MKCRGACASSELLRLQNYLILGLRKLWARLSDSATLRRSITPVDETAITSVSFLSGDFCPCGADAAESRIYPGYWTSADIPTVVLGPACRQMLPCGLHRCAGRVHLYNPGKEICWSASSQKRVHGDSSLGSPEDLVYSRTECGK